MMPAPTLPPTSSENTRTDPRASLPLPLSPSPSLSLSLSLALSLSLSLSSSFSSLLSTYYVHDCLFLYLSLPLYTSALSHDIQLMDLWRHLFVIHSTYIKDIYHHIVSFDT